MSDTAQTPAPTTTPAETPAETLALTEGGRAEARIQKLAREQQALQAQLAALEADRAAERAQYQQELARARQDLAFTSAGVPPEMRAHVAAIHQAVGNGKPLGEWLAEARTSDPLLSRALGVVPPTPAAPAPTTTGPTIPAPNAPGLSMGTAREVYDTALAAVRRNNTPENRAALLKAEEGLRAASTPRRP